MNRRSLSIEDLPPHLQAEARAQVVNGVALGPKSPLMKSAALPAKRRDLEGLAQRRVIAWANNNLTVWPELRWLFHVPNGGARSPRTAGMLKAAGVKPGVPDLLLPVARVRFVGFALELKSEEGSPPTAEQTDWLAHLAGEGWKTAVAFGADDAITRMVTYLRTGGF